MPDEMPVPPVVAGRAIVSLWRTALTAVALFAAGMSAFGTIDAHADPRGGLRQARPEADGPQPPRRIPGEGVQEDAPEVEDEADERKAAPLPDVDGCPYRGRKLELIV